MSLDNPLDLYLEGHCDCRAVALRADGKPLSMFHCACSHCQRSTGTGHSSIVLFPRDKVTLSGETKSYARPADSGATFTRHFCPLCATTAFAHSSRAPTMTIVPIGLFAGNNDWFKPNQLIFAQAHAAWDLIHPDLPRHDTYRLGKNA